jgi:hypothetical protein
MHRSDDTKTSATSFEIKGALKFPKKTQDTQEIATKRVPGKL